jgi:hypothetical protein
VTVEDVIIAFWGRAGPDVHHCAPTLNTKVHKQKQTMQQMFTNYNSLCMLQKKVVICKHQVHEEFWITLYFKIWIYGNLVHNTQYRQ